MLVTVMGVSGSGKTTVGAALAQRLRVPFADADDFHPPANIAKMSAGHPARRRRPAPVAARPSASGCADARRERRRDELLGAQARSYRDVLRERRAARGLRPPARATAR